TVDGTVLRGSTAHVFINPAVFDRLGPTAAQIVVSHEATHVATGGAVSSMPQWLIEGFADYVALHALNVPTSVSARQIISEVQKDGPPPKLPTSADFAGGAPDLGATYEAAWLACRQIADEFGQEA